MKFKLKQKTTPKLGDTKIKNKFLIFPLCLENECRWLCRVNILYKYSSLINGGDDSGPYFRHDWEPIKFI